MPYRTNASLPETVSGLPAHAKDIWRNAFNSAESQHGADDESRLARIAWGAVKRSYAQDADGNWRAIEKQHATWSLPIAKADDARQLVFGWASIAVAKDGTPVIDLQGDMIAIEDLEDAMYAYVRESGELNFDHAGETRGQLVEALVFTPDKLEKMGIPAGTVPLGAWVGYHLPDQADYARAKDGGLLMFSIEGRGVREAV